MLQRLPENTTYSVETDVYGAAVGTDIDRYLVGQEDWTKLVDAITKAFVVMAQELIFAEILEAHKKLPAQTQFVQTGALNTANRKKFNKVLQNVSVANDNAEVVIMGTMVGLQELEGLIDINWIASSQKEDKAKMGRLGNYGRYTLVEIPQRFAKNDLTKDMYKDDVLYVFASGDEKLVDMVDVGETFIEEITDRGTANANIADIMKYEVQREFGIATRIGIIDQLSDKEITADVVSDVIKNAVDFKVDESEIVDGLKSQIGNLRDLLRDERKKNKTLEKKVADFGARNVLADK